MTERFWGWTVSFVERVKRSVWHDRRKHELNTTALNAAISLLMCPITHPGTEGAMKFTFRLQTFNILTYITQNGLCHISRQRARYNSCENDYCKIVWPSSFLTWHRITFHHLLVHQLGMRSGQYTCRLFTFILVRWKIVIHSRFYKNSRVRNSYNYVK